MNIKFDDIFNQLRRLYFSDNRPWIVGYSGGKDSTLLVSLIFQFVSSLPLKLRNKEINIVCTDTGVEIPAILERIVNELDLMKKTSLDLNLNIKIHLLRPRMDQTFWVNLLGRGYPPPNRIFRWCTQRLKINPVSDFIRDKIGHWGEAIVLLGSRREESIARSQTLNSRPVNELGLRRHEDLPRCWIASPIEYLTLEDVWEFLLEHKNPWGSSNVSLFQLYKNASGGECPFVIDRNSPACGNSRFGCWTCTVVKHDKASEGLLETGDFKMKDFLAYREKLLQFRDPENGYRDPFRKNGQRAPGPLTLEARKILLDELLKLQNNVQMSLIKDEELLWIQTLWKSSRQPDDGRGVTNILYKYKDIKMEDQNIKQSNLRFIEETVTLEKNISLDTLRRLIAKVEEYSESHRAVGLPDELLQILQDELASLPEDN